MGKFVLTADGKSDVENPSEANVTKVIASLRSQGPVSFTALSDQLGNYVQAAGGQATCMLEKYAAAEGRLFRAFQAKKSTIFQDGAVLAFNGGNVSLTANEWFLASDAKALFLSFLHGEAEPSHVQWRDISDMLKKK